MADERRESEEAAVSPGADGTDRARPEPSCLAEVKAAAIADLMAAWRDIPPGLKYRVEPLQPGDGRGVAQLFHMVYGDRYPVVDYYMPETIERMNAEGRLLTVVARLESGEIAGQGAYYQSSPPNKALFEYGQVLIAPAYRGGRMVLEISKALDRLWDTMPQAEGFFGESVCTHLVTQKLGVRRGCIECGLEVSLMPAGAYANEGAGAQRVSCLISVIARSGPHRALHLPLCYREPLTPILQAFPLPREVRFDALDEPVAAQSSLQSQIFEDAGVVRAQALRVGADFPALARALDEDAKQRGLAVAQVFVNAGEPGTAFAAQALRELGFVLGGLIPLWFGADGLLLQKFYVEPEFDAIQLYSDKAKALRDAIRAEWAEVSARG